MRTVKVGLVGVGDISGIYLKNIHETFREIELVGICDLKREKAEKAKEKYPNLKIYESMGEIFADPAIEVVLKLRDGTGPVVDQALIAGDFFATPPGVIAALEARLRARDVQDLAALAQAHLESSGAAFLGIGPAAVVAAIAEAATMAREGRA